MEEYQDFAAVYDRFMDDIPYDHWCEVLLKHLRAAQIRDGLVLDLCCGTGSMTRRLSAAGYDMIGVDASVEMLNAAREQGGEGILYLCQDMRSFELYGTVRAVVSVCDSLNYLTTEEELRTVFRLADNYLDPGGLFLFDMNLPEKYEQIPPLIGENRDFGSFLWENEYDRERRENLAYLTFYLEEADGLYRRSEEVHRQRAYPPETVLGLLREARLLPLGTELLEAEGRMLFIAKEQTK